MREIIKVILENLETESIIDFVDNERHHKKFNYKDFMNISLVNRQIYTITRIVGYKQFKLVNKELYKQIIKFGSNFLFHCNDYNLVNQFLDIFGYDYSNKKDCDLCSLEQCLCYIRAGIEGVGMEMGNHILWNVYEDITPLEVKVCSGNENILQSFLKFTQAREELNNMLHDWCKKGNYNTVKFLIHIGADINYKDKFGFIPIYHSLYYPKIVKMLIHRCIFVIHFLYIFLKIIRNDLDFPHSRSNNQKLTNFMVHLTILSILKLDRVIEF